MSHSEAQPMDQEKNAAADPVAAPSTETPPAATSAAPADEPKAADKVADKAASAFKRAQQAAGKAAAFGATQLDPQRHDGLCVVRYLERMVERVRSAMGATPADASFDRLVHYGNLAALAAMLVALALGLLTAVRHAVLAPIPRAIGFVLLLAAFQYAANKFLKAGRTMMEATPSRLSSPAFLNTVALLNAVMAVVFLLGGLLLAVQLRTPGIFAAGVMLAFVAYGVAFIALYPDRINVTVDPGVSAGEEALGILSFSIKVVIRLIPIVYGVGMIVGTLTLVAACFALLGRSGTTLLGQQGRCLLLTAAAFPFAGYLFFAFNQLLLDILRAILILPSKIGARQNG